MSAIHYKYSSSNDYKNVTFNGLSISVQDCKRAIMEKEKLKFTEVDLRLTNAQNLKDYKEEADLIPKNSSLLVRRVPVGGTRNTDKTKVYIVKKKQTAADNKPGSGYLTLDQLKRTNDLATANASEQDKIKAMIDQSTTEYDPSKYYKPPRPGSYQRHDAQNSHSSHIKCYKCNQPGHYSQHCRLNKPIERPKAIRPATGIPRSHMVQVNKDAKGAMLTPDGQYVVPFIDKKGYEVGKKEKPPFLPDADDGKDDEEEEPVPDELICLLCKEIMEDAVVIPCCGNSYCDECIRNALLESDEHECPTCHKKSISPDSLIANKFLRQAVNKFRNETGISRKKSKNTPVWPRPAAVETKQAPPAPKPTKVTYAPPQSNSSTPVTSTGGEYVVKAKSAQVYAAAGYTIKKATQVTPAKPEAATVKDAAETPTESISSGNSTLGSEAKSTSEFDICDIHPPGVSPESASAAVRCLSLEGNSDEEAETRKVALRKYGCKQSQATTTGGDVPTKINPLNMMVARPETESPPPPPPPPPLPVDSNKGEDNASQDATAANLEEDKPENKEPENAKSPNHPPTAENSPPSLLDDTLETFNHYPVQSQSISITLKNAPAVQSKPPAANSPQPATQVPSTQSALSLAEPPMHVLMPAQKQLGATVPPVLPPPRMSIPPPSLSHPTGLPLSLSQGHIRIPPPSIMQSGIRLPNIPTSIPPPNFLPPTGSTIGIPPPLGALHPGMLPPHLPFPPPPGLPPPGYLSQALPGQSIDAPANSAPPPPGTGTPPIIMTRRREDRRERTERSLSRSKRDSNREKSPSRNKKSKLAIMSDEFTREQKQKAQTRRKKHRRRSKSRSSSGSSSSYSSSSRSSSNSSYSSSGSSSSYSSSQSSSRSRSATPQRRKKRGKRSRRSESHSSRSSSSPRKRRVRKIGKRRKEPAPSSGSRRRRSRSFDADSPRRRKRHHRSRSRSRERKRSTQKSGVVIPGMPPQSVLDYERDVALYEYYKQKYEQDWLRSRISPPSPFKRFINYNPTKVPPPSNHPTQVQSHSSHVIPIQTHANPLYSQPPPPGDATPTEEDAGLYGFRAPTPPDNYFVPPGHTSWDVPRFEGNLTERARILQEEDYYNQMQRKLNSDRAWSRSRHPDIHDQRGDFERRSRDRHDGDRRRRGFSPARDRGRSWEHEADRYHSRRRRSENEMSRGRRNSREREHDSRSRRRDRSQKESRSSRQESSQTRKRAHEQSGDTSSRPSSHRIRRDRENKKLATPERKVSDEPYPPGEGDGTPVRDESRVEFMNERIKVKVVNEKVKPKEEKRSHKSTEGRSKETARKSEKSRTIRQDTERRVVKSRDPSPKVEETKSESQPIMKRSPTPTLDEEVDDTVPSAQPPHVELENDAAPVESINVNKQSKPEPDEKIPEQNSEHTTLKRPRPADGKKVVPVPVRKTKVKVKQTKDAENMQTHPAKTGKVTTGKPVPMPKSKWDSDGEAPQKKSGVENDKADKKSEKSFTSAPIKSRKIRIKKPGAISINSQAVNKAPNVSNDSEQKTEVDGEKSSPPVSDSRRVVVSSAPKSTVEPPAPQPAMKLPRIIRQSTSHIDEASFEPDYNDNEIEKALSNYAPSDIDDDNNTVEKISKGEPEPVVESANVNEKPRKKRKNEEVEVDVKDDVTEDSEESRDKNKRKKKKKRKHKKHKHHHVRESDYEADSVSEDDGSRSPVSRVTVKKSTKQSDDWESDKHKKDHKHHERPRKSHKRKHEHGGRKRKSDKVDRDDEYSDEEPQPPRKRSHSHRSPKEKKRKTAEPDEDALSLDEDLYSLDEYRSPSPEEKRKHKKKQKHKRSKKESKDVRRIASRIRLPK